MRMNIIALWANATLLSCPGQWASQQPGIENSLDIDVVEAGGLDLEEFDASVGRSGQQIRADIAP